MTDDANEQDVSISVEIVPTGLKAGAKSRIVSAIDRLGGNLVELVNVPLENHLKKGRAVGRADVKLIDGLGEIRLQQLHQNPEFAAKALEQHLKTAISRQENKAHVVVQALEDLRNDPPTDEQSAAGPEAVSEDFMNRFERYAEDATSDQVRERWGRVLASEVRIPGTFSAKVLRLVDEMEAATAILFERVCKNRLGDFLPLCLFPDIAFDERKRLITAGLLLDPGFGGQLRKSVEITDTLGEKLSTFVVGDHMIAFHKPTAYPNSGNKRSALTDHEGSPALNVWVLTDEAHAISSILPSEEAHAVARLMQIIADEVSPAGVLEFTRLSDDQFRQIRSISTPVDGTPPTDAPKG